MRKKNESMDLSINDPEKITGTQAENSVFAEAGHLR
jgi:hypothetical protein